MLHVLHVCEDCLLGMISNNKQTGTKMGRCAAGVQVHTLHACNVCRRADTFMLHMTKSGWVGLMPCRVHLLIMCCLLKLAAVRRVLTYALAWLTLSIPVPWSHPRGL